MQILKSITILESGENWVKKVFDTNMAVGIGQRVSRGLFLGQF